MFVNKSKRSQIRPDFPRYAVSFQSVLAEIYTYITWKRGFIWSTVCIINVSVSVRNSILSLFPCDPCRKGGYNLQRLAIKQLFLQIVLTFTMPQMPITAKFTIPQAAMKSNLPFKVFFFGLKSSSNYTSHHNPHVNFNLGVALVFIDF